MSKAQSPSAPGITSPSASAVKEERRRSRAIAYSTAGTRQWLPIVTVRPCERWRQLITSKSPLGLIYVFQLAAHEWSKMAFDANVSVKCPLLNRYRATGPLLEPLNWRTNRKASPCRAGKRASGSAAWLVHGTRDGRQVRREFDGRADALAFAEKQRLGIPSRLPPTGNFAMRQLGRHDRGPFPPPQLD